MHVEKNEQMTSTIILMQLKKTSDKKYINYYGQTL